MNRATVQHLALLASHSSTVCSLLSNVQQRN